MREFDEVFKYFKRWKLITEKSKFEDQRELDSLNRELKNSPVPDLEKKLSDEKYGLDRWKSKLSPLEIAKDNYDKHSKGKEPLTRKTLIMLRSHENRGHSYPFIVGIEYDIRTAQREIERRQAGVDQINETLQATLKNHRSSKSIIEETEKLNSSLILLRRYSGILESTCDCFKTTEGRPDRKEALMRSAFYRKALRMYEDSKQRKRGDYDLKGLGELNTLCRGYIEEIESAQRSRASSARVTAPTARVGGRPGGPSSAADSRRPQR